MALASASAVALVAGLGVLLLLGLGQADENSSSALVAGMLIAAIVLFLIAFAGMVFAGIVTTRLGGRGAGVTATSMVAGVGLGPLLFLGITGLQLAGYVSLFPLVMLMASLISTRRGRADKRPAARPYSDSAPVVMRLPRLEAIREDFGPPRYGGVDRRVAGYAFAVLAIGGVVSCVAVLFAQRSGAAPATLAKISVWAVAVPVAALAVAAVTRLVLSRRSGDDSVATEPGVRTPDGAAPPVDAHGTDQ